MHEQPESGLPFVTWAGGDGGELERRGVTGVKTGWAWRLPQEADCPEQPAPGQEAEPGEALNGMACALGLWPLGSAGTGRRVCWCVFACVLWWVCGCMGVCVLVGVCSCACTGVPSACMCSLVHCWARPASAAVLCVCSRVALCVWCVHLRRGWWWQGGSAVGRANAA